jgi:hypothetical protein
MVIAFFEGKLHKRYIGFAEDLTLKRLEEVARQLDEPAPGASKVSICADSIC